MDPVLPRRPGTADTVVLGLAAMLGTGVFVVFAPAAGAAGPWLPLAVLVAAVVALCNMSSTADLAAAHPDSEFCHGHARERLGPWAGRLAGVAFLAAKTASAAAAAGVFGRYVLPSHPLWAAVPLVVVATGITMSGMRWTLRGAWALVSALLVVLFAVGAVGLVWRRSPLDFSAAASDGATGPEIGPAVDPGLSPGVLGVLTAAALMFFAFAGDARAAAAGSAADPRSGVAHRALPIALVIALLSYLLLAGGLLHSLGSEQLAASDAPLVAAVGALDAPGLGVLVRLAAAAATVSALLGVLAGVGRTGLELARRRELPGRLAVVGARDNPWRVELVGGGVAVLVTVWVNPIAALAFSACCVLVYHAVLNAAALRLPFNRRHWPAWTSALGLLLCLLLAALLPLAQVLIATAVLMLGWLSSSALSRRAEPDTG